MYIPKICRNIIYDDLQQDRYFIHGLEEKKINYIIDIGASYGLISIAYKLSRPRTKVYSIEPDPDVYKHLVENVCVLDIKCFNIDLGDGSTFHLEKERKTSLCNSYRKEESKYKSEKSSQSFTLHEIIEKCQAEGERLLLKVDCEGAEKYLFQNEKSRDILGRCAAISIEMHKIDGEFNPSLPFLYDFYGNIGYQCSHHIKSEMLYIFQAKSPFFCL